MCNCSGCFVSALTQNTHKCTQKSSKGDRSWSSVAQIKAIAEIFGLNPRYALEFIEQIPADTYLH